MKTISSAQGFPGLCHQLQNLRSIFILTSFCLFVLYARVVCMHVLCVGRNMCRCTCVYTCTQKPRADLRDLPQSFSTFLFLRQGLCRTQLSRQPACPGIPRPCLCKYGLRAAAVSAWLSTRVLRPQIPVLMHECFIPSSHLPSQSTVSANTRPRFCFPLAELGPGNTCRISLQTLCSPPASASRVEFYSC